jgi:lysophospholipase L1-like esterase
VLAALAGASLGWGAVVVAERSQLEAGPSGWALSHPRIPLRLARLAGPPRLPGEGWPLDSHGVLSRPGVMASRVDVVAQLPPTGNLSLQLLPTERGAAGAALVVSRVDQGFSGVARAKAQPDEAELTRERRAWMNCTPPLPAVGEAPVALSLSIEGEVVLATVGDTTATCDGAASPGVPEAVAGLRRVGIHSLSVDQSSPHEAPTAAWFGRIFAALFGAALVGGIATWVRRRGARGVTLAAAPLLATAALANADLAALLQGARVSADAPLLWAVGGPVALSLVLIGVLAQAAWVRRDGDSGLRVVAVAGGAAGLAATLSFGVSALAGGVVGAAGAVCGWALLKRIAPEGAPGRGVVGAMAAGGLIALATLAMSPRWGLSATWAGLSGTCLGLVVWANARAAAVRAFNLVSLVLFCLSIAFAEQALVWTATGQSLASVSSRAPADGSAAPTDSAASVFASFEALERTREFQAYPMANYPVRPPDPDGRPRVVAFGSSSTAGAYQNDNVDQFWPADVEREFGGAIQVVNQGVGGWTSLHVRRYIETRSELLAPDLAIVYLGHNDLLTETRRPYREIYGAWLLGTNGAGARVSEILGSLRLYQLLRFSLSSAGDRGSGPAVPISDARANLQGIIDTVRSGGGKTLLVVEAISPDPGAMARYTETVAALAAAAPDDVAWLDGGAVLSDPLLADQFLDDCHLTRAGHMTLAEAIANQLRDRGWAP